MLNLINDQIWKRLSYTVSPSNALSFES